MGLRPFASGIGVRIAPRSQRLITRLEVPTECAVSECYFEAS